MTTPKRRCAQALLAAAGRVLPPHRSRWAEAMHRETDFLNDSDALRWAAGCLRASLMQRSDDMMKGNSRVAAPILIAELLLCFAPLTLMWYDATAGLMQFSTHADHGQLLSSTAGTFMLTFLLYAAVLGIVGPATLLGSLASAVTGRPLPGWLISTCMAVPVPLVALLLLSYGLADARDLASLDLWRGCLLLLLPIPAALHLQHLGAVRPVQNQLG